MSLTDLVILDLLRLLPDGVPLGLLLLQGQLLELGQALRDLRHLLHGQAQVGLEVQGL